jgi:hypothetical protein
MYKGSCLCNEVNIEVDGSIETIIHCHCTRCRKTSGSSFATNGYLFKKYFSITKGHDFICFFDSGNGKKRHFCRKCASPIYSENIHDLQRVRLRLGILDDDISELPESHNFVKSKANWDILSTKIPCYDAYEPSRDFTKQ